jgi:integrase
MTPNRGVVTSVPRLWLVPTDMKNELITPLAWKPELEMYVGWLRASSRPQTTIKLRVYHLRRFAVRSGLDPFEVTLDDLVEHLSNNDWGAHTRRSVRASFRVFYNWAHATGRVAVNNAALLPPVAVPMGKPRPARDDAVLIGMHATDPRVQLMVALAARAGLRCGEIAGVHARDVLDDHGGKSLRVLGKGARVRKIPIADDLATMIRERAQGGWLFPGKIDGHLSAGYVSKLISWALPADTTAHPLRHRFASRAFKGSGNNLRAVQELLGHASIATTQIYTAVDDDDLRQAAMSAA